MSISVVRPAGVVPVSADWNMQWNDRPLATRCRFESLNALRGVAALLVVLCHVAAFVGEEPTLWHRYGIYLSLRGSALGVQLFFVLSGLVIYISHRSDVGRPSTAPSFFWKRFRRIYPVYWIFFLLTVLKHEGTAGSYLSYQSNPFVIVSGIVLVHLFSYQTNMVVAWTLFDEVLFYLAFSTLLLNKRIGAAVLFLWLGTSLYFLVPSEGYWSLVFSPNHLLFGMGILVAWLLERNYRAPARMIFCIGVAGFIVCVAIAGQMARGITVHLAAGLAAAAILFGAADLERRNHLTVPRWLGFLGDASYSIYLAHFMIISAVARFSFSHWRALPVPIGVWMVLLFLAGTAAGIATHMLVEMPLLRMLGKRPPASFVASGLSPSRIQ
jgi:exopolysaccharide production protein ExoZ